MINLILRTRRVASIVFVLGVLICVLGFTNNGPLIKGAREYSKDIATSSAATYLSLRLLNAAISFAEEVEVGGYILVVSGSAHPFKVLEPIDDAVERLSSAVFVVGTLAGVLTVVLPVLGGVALVSIGASITALAALSLSGLRFPGQSFVVNLLNGTAQLGGLAFLIVVSFSISSWFADGISNRAWGDYQQVLDEVADAMPSFTEGDLSISDAEDQSASEGNLEVVESEDPTASDEDTGFFGKAIKGIKATGEGAKNIADATFSGVSNLTGSAVDGVKGMVDSTAAAYEKADYIVEVLSTRSDDLVRALMGIFAAFLFKTVVFPMLILAGLWKLAGNFSISRKVEQPVP